MSLFRDCQVFNPTRRKLFVSFAVSPQVRRVLRQLPAIVALAGSVLSAKASGEIELGSRLRAG